MCIRDSDKIEELQIMLENKKQDMSSLLQELEDTKQQLESSESERKESQSVAEELKQQLEEITSDSKEALKLKGIEISSLHSQLEQSLDENEALQQDVEKLKSEIEAMSYDVEQKQKLEQESKERVLQIGKLRHEAIILNEHLTKALAMLKPVSYTHLDVYKRQTMQCASKMSFLGVFQITSKIGLYYTTI